MLLPLVFALCAATGMGDLGGVSSGVPGGSSSGAMISSLSGTVPLGSGGTYLDGLSIALVLDGVRCSAVLECAVT